VTPKGGFAATIPIGGPGTLGVTRNLILMPFLAAG
jgi:hypothetical protein